MGIASATFLRNCGQIFGKSEDEPLDYEASKSEFDKLVKDINAQTKGSKSADEVAWG